MFDDHGRINAAAHIELGAYPHEVGAYGLDDMVKHFIGDRFVECAFIAERPYIKF